jgi:hypothetical protein
MRITELIRDILDIIDGAERQQPNDSQEQKGYSDRDIKRFKQIIDLADTDQDAGYSNAPKEQYADINSVTIDAGSDSINGTKHPADIRGEHPSLYPGKVYGAK